MTSNIFFLFLCWTFGGVGNVVSFDIVQPKLAATSLLNFSQKNSEAVDLSTAVTPSTSVAIFNFGPASARDTVVHTAERPGNNPHALLADEQQVQSWLAFMKQQDVSHVIALLDENEYVDYYDAIAPGGGLLKIYEMAGLTCLVQPMSEPDAGQNIFRFIRHAEACASAKSNGKVVVHCTGGIGRAGRVAAGWLVSRYGCTPAEATAEVLEQATVSNIHRKGSAEQLEAWLNAGLIS